VFGAVVFFDREIPTNWPTGVFWKSNKESTKNWKYVDNPLEYENEVVINDREAANVRFYTV